MEQKTNVESSDTTESTKKFAFLHKVTPISKYLAMLLFILLPFVGAWLGFEQGAAIKEATTHQLEYEIQQLTEESDRLYIDVEECEFEYLTGPGGMHSAMTFFVAGESRFDNNCHVIAIEQTAMGAGGYEISECFIPRSLGIIDVEETEFTLSGYFMPDISKYCARVSKWFGGAGDPWGDEQKNADTQVHFDATSLLADPEVIELGGEYAITKYACKNYFFEVDCFQLYEIDGDDVEMIHHDITTVLRGQEFNQFLALKHIYTSTDKERVYFERFIPASSGCCTVVEFKPDTLEFKTIETPNIAVNGDSTSPSGKYIAHIDYDSSVEVYSLEEQQIVHTSDLSVTETTYQSFCGYASGIGTLDWEGDTLTYNIYEESTVPTCENEDREPVLIRTVTVEL